MMDIDVWYTGLLFSCPFNKSVGKCLFNEQRKLPKLEAIKQWRKLSFNERKTIIDKHVLCSLKHIVQNKSI